jgi:hypothetical protein
MMQSGGADALKARILAAAAATPSTTRKRGKQMALLAVALSIGFALMLFELAGGLAHSRDRPLGQTVRLADGWGLVSTVLTWLVLGRGGSTLARSPPVLLSATAASPIALYAWMQHFPTLGIHQDTEVLCLLLTVAFGSAPLAAFLALRRGLEPSHPGILGAAAGAMSGAWAAVLVLLWCPQTDALHALVGHVLPNILLIALGAKIGSSTLAPRPV